MDCKGHAFAEGSRGLGREERTKRSPGGFQGEALALLAFTRLPRAPAMPVGNAKCMPTNPIAPAGFSRPAPAAYHPA